MDFEFLSPVEDAVVAHNQLLPKQALGRKIRIHTTKSGLPDLTNVAVAIFGVGQVQHIESDKTIRTQIRHQLYQLFPGNWNYEIADLGDILPGATQEDTHFAVKELCAFLLQRRIIPLVLGDSQELTYPTYRSFDVLGRTVNIVSVDTQFDFGEADELVSSQSYMSKIIVEKPNMLFNFCNLGYQTFFNAQEEIDLMDKLFFEAYRLGEVVNDITLVEPVMRDADLVTIDMNVVKASDIGYVQGASPNGLTGMHMCAVSRYAGISDRVSLFGVYQMKEGEQSSMLIAQMLWYFLEGYNYRYNETPNVDNANFKRYIVPIDAEQEQLTFFKSDVSGRWWVEIPLLSNLDNKLKRHALLPCMHKDYLDACDNKIPERWWKALRKTVV